MLGIASLVKNSVRELDFDSVDVKKRFCAYCRLIGAAENCGYLRSVVGVASSPMCEFRKNLVAVVDGNGAVRDHYRVFELVVGVNIPCAAFALGSSRKLTEILLNDFDNFAVGNFSVLILLRDKPCKNDIPRHCAEEEFARNKNLAAVVPADKAEILVYANDLRTEKSAACGKLEAGFRFENITAPYKLGQGTLELGQLLALALAFAVKCLERNAFFSALLQYFFYSCFVNFKS